MTRPHIVGVVSVGPNIHAQVVWLGFDKGLSIWEGFNTTFMDMSGSLSFMLRHLNPANRPVWLEGPVWPPGAEEWLKLKLLEQALEGNQ